MAALAGHAYRPNVAQGMPLKVVLLHVCWALQLGVITIVGCLNEFRLSQLGST